MQGNQEQAHIKVKETCIEVFCRGSKDPISWDFRHLRQYGVHGGLFTFESGRKGPEGPQKYLFKCTRAQQLFEQVRAGATQNLRELGPVIPTPAAPGPAALGGPSINDRRIAEQPAGEAIPLIRRSPTTPNSPNNFAVSYVNVEIPPNLPARFGPAPAASPPAPRAPNLEDKCPKPENTDSEEEFEHPEINYLELDHTEEPRESRESRESRETREPNNNEEGGEQSYAEIDITSTQALTDLRANEDSHTGQMRHDTTLDSIHSSTSMNLRSSSTCTAILGFGASNGKL